MNDVDAASYADSVIRLILQHQQNPFGSQPLDSDSTAKQTAKQLVAFRSQLIEEMMKQPR